MAPAVEETPPSDPLEAFYFNEAPQVVCGVQVPPITDTTLEDHPSVVERFFSRQYYIKPGADGTPYQVLHLTNRVCLITLVPEHPALRVGVESLTYDIGNMDRSKNQVRGKGKKGGMPLQQDTTLAILTAKDGKTYKIPSCVRGKLIEVNERLVEEPELLEKDFEGVGYLAIVLPKLEGREVALDGLLTQDQYEEHLRTRAEKEATAEKDA